jgi:hypothetical protein
MGLFDRLKSGLTLGKLQKEQLERLRESIWNSVADGVISEQELSYINDFYTASELNDEEFRKLKNEIFSLIIQQAISDRRVTESELNSLNHICQRLEISPEVERWAQKQVEYYAAISRIESGAPLHTEQPSGLIMQKNEVCYLSLPAQLIEERVVARNYVGGSHGVSVRIMKGISYRVGQQRGQMTSQTGFVPISDGYFIVTNKRLFFSGSRKSVSTNLDKLLDLQVFADGLKIASTSRQKPTYISFYRSEEAELAAVLISRIINES